MTNPFDIDGAIAHLREAVKPFLISAMLALADMGEQVGVQKHR